MNINDKPQTAEDILRIALSKPRKPLKCKDHRGSRIGGAVCTQGKCRGCEKIVSAGCGSCPELCAECSWRFGECADCGVKIKDTAKLSNL